MIFVSFYCMGLIHYLHTRAPRGLNHNPRAKGFALKCLRLIESFIAVIYATKQSSIVSRKYL